MENKFIEIINCFNLFFLMKNLKINQSLIKKLSSIIEKEQIAAFIEKFQKQVQIERNSATKNLQTEKENPVSKKHKRLASQSKQRLLLRRKESKKVLRQEANGNQSTQTEERPSPLNQKGQNKILKDRAVFVNVSEIPYLHSTDLLNHLYKKSSSFGQQKQVQMTLYNPPANNPYALTKVKYLSIYYCKIESLRDMGTGWSNLVQLSVYFGGLKDLSGLNAFPSLEYLHCPFNSISTISDLMFHSTLVSVDFESNLISDLAEVQHLFTIENLQYVNLINNPVYLSKQNKRKINEKFQKIIESQNNRLEQYVNDRQRQAWELVNIEGVEYCNNILKEFFIQSKSDQITVETKHQLCSSKSQHADLEFEAFQAGLNETYTKQSQNEKQFNIYYILPEIPENQYFEEMILKGITEQSQMAGFCQQKIYLTPLSAMINKNENYIGPVLNKYLQNKLYITDIYKQPKSKGQRIQGQTEQKSEIKTSKLKRVSKLDMTDFSSKGFSSSGFSAISVEQSGQQIQRSKEFETTTSSFSTNCTNLNNTSTNFSFRRTRLTLSKSKQKSVNKTSFISQVQEHLISSGINNFNSNNFNSSSLAKQSRLLLGKSLKKEIKDNIDLNDQRSDQKGFQRHNNDEHLGEKHTFHTGLKRKTMLSSGKKQKSFVLTRKEQRHLA